MKKNCLVLGGEGFLGSHLVDDLLANGYSVKLFDRFENGHSKIFKQETKDLEFFKGDFFDQENLNRALRGIDFVFHFISIGCPALTVNDPKKDIESNIIGTVNLLEACVKNQIKRVIYPSSGGAIYGDVKEGNAKEDSPSNPITPYSIDKLCIEKYFNYYKRHHGLDSIIYRISNPYGPRQPLEGAQGVIPAIIKKALSDESIDIFGNSVRDYIYIKDVTRFIADSFSKSHLYDIYNLGSGEGTSLTDLTDTIENVVQRKVKKNQLAKREFDVARIILNINRIKEEFSFSPSVNLSDGIKMTYEFIQKNFPKGVK